MYGAAINQFQEHCSSGKIADHKDVTADARSGDGNPLAHWVDCLDMHVYCFVIQRLHAAVVCQLTNEDI